MEQLAFFVEPVQSKGLPKELIEYRPGVISAEGGERLMQQMIAEAPWKQGVQRMYDKDVITPRLTAWYGDPDVYDSVAWHNDRGKNAGKEPGHSPGKFRAGTQF